jgi:endo-1,3-1,4-beta-glycanase ExoK
LGSFAAVGPAGVSPSHAQEAKATGSFLENFDKFDRSRWFISDGWKAGDHQNCTWSKGQVRVKDGVLRIGFARAESGDKALVCGEVQSKKRYSYGTYEVRMKAASGAGLDQGFFTYIGPNDKQPWDEIDFEVLGKDPSQVQLNYYVDGKGGHEQLVPVPGGAEAGFNDYAFVWEKDRIRWYVDGELVRTAEDPAGLPSHASKIFMSIWGSDKMKSWLGAFVEPTGPLTLEVDRVAFTALGDACQFPESVACSLD